MLTKFLKKLSFLAVAGVLSTQGHAGDPYADYANALGNPNVVVGISQMVNNPADVGNFANIQNLTPLAEQQIKASIIVGRLEAFGSVGTAVPVAAAVLPSYKIGGTNLATGIFISLAAAANANANFSSGALPAAGAQLAWDPILCNTIPNAAAGAAGITLKGLYNILTSAADLTTYLALPASKRNDASTIVLADFPGSVVLTTLALAQGFGYLAQRSIAQLLADLYS